MVAFVRNLIDNKRRFIQDHRFDMSEIYSDEFEEEMKAIPDPKKEPLDCLDQFLAILDEFGAWGADRAALNLIMQIEKLKIKTPYERHYLLLCLVSTTLIQVRAHCDHVFGQLANEKERIETYSSQKVLRLLEVLRQFKPPDTKPFASDTDKPPSAFVKKHETELNAMNFNKVATAIETTTKNVKNTKPEFEHVSEALTKLVTTPNASNAICNGMKTLPAHRSRNTKGKRTPFQRAPRQYHNNHHQHDPDALCGLLFCSSKFIAKILYNLCYEASKGDAELSFLMVQYTVDRAADPVTESKQAENEHRRQEEVLKRFRMHACNLLIGTSVLEEGIELPKCNLVIRWDPPSTYRSYVQCKGRARSQNAQHIIMVAPANKYKNDQSFEFQPPSHRFLCDGNECFNDEENDLATTTVKPSIDDVPLMETETETIVKRLAQYMHIEQILIGKCDNREPMASELSEADRFTACIQSYQPRKHEMENAPSVNLSTAILLINKYCAKLPSDTFTKLTPLWRCAKTNRNRKEYFQYTVRLPINSPVKQDILVRIL